VEEFAVQAVKSIFLSQSNLIPYIDSNDKYPTWDGEVICYKNNKINKDNILGRIPVQVKGTKVDEFTFGHSRTFPCEINDLKNYKNDNGAMYFVVEVKSSIEQKVFLAKFLPKKLSDILAEAEKRGNKKTISCKFHQVTDKNILNACLSFIKNRDIQKSNIVVDFEELMHKNKIEKIHMIGDISIEKNKALLDANETYLYAYLRDIDKPVTISNLSNFLEMYNLHFGINSKLSINGEMYPNKIFSGLSKDSRFIAIDSFIKIFEDEENKKANIEFKFNGSLKDIISTLKFINDVAVHESFNIDNIDFNLSEITNISSKDYLDFKVYIQELYQFYKDLRKLLDIFNIDEDISVTNFSDEEFADLNYLIGYFLYNMKITLNSKVKEDNFINLMEIKIGNILLLAWGVKIQNNSDIHPIFKDDIFNLSYKKIKNTIIKYDIELKIRETYISSFFRLDKNILCKPHNGFTSEKILRDISYYEFTDEFILAMNGFILELINAYDECENGELLRLALELIKKVKEVKEVDIYMYINEQQIKKRIGHLKKDDIFKLADIYKNTEDLATKFGIDVIMDDKESAYKHFNEMGLEDRDNYKNYPIYNLYKKLISK